MGKWPVGNWLHTLFQPVTGDSMAGQLNRPAWFKAAALVPGSDFLQTHLLQQGITNRSQVLIPG